MFQSNVIDLSPPKRHTDIIPYFRTLWVIWVLHRFWDLIHSFSCKQRWSLPISWNIFLPGLLATKPFCYSSYLQPLFFSLFLRSFSSIQTQAHIFSLDTLLFISSVYFLHNHLPSHGFISNLHLQDRPLPWDLDLYTQLPSHPLHSNIKHTCQSKISKTSLDFLLKPASPPSFTLSKWEHHPHSYLDPKFRPCCWFLYKHTPHSHHFTKFSPPSVYVPNLNSSLPPLLPT